jgi:metal-responsive CopG/Arc/MetJ family transcriptional regulator
MGRRAYQVPRVAWKCYIPEDLAAEVDLLLMDPLRAKAEYGARSELLIQLLRAWMAERRRGVANLGENGDNNPVINHPINPPEGPSNV